MEHKFIKNTFYLKKQKLDNYQTIAPNDDPNHIFFIKCFTSDCEITIKRRDSHFSPEEVERFIEIIALYEKEKR